MYTRPRCVSCMRACACACACTPSTGMAEEDERRGKKRSTRKEETSGIEVGEKEPTSVLFLSPPFTCHQSRE